MMTVHPSGYYAWRAEPMSARRKEDQRLMGLIKQSWLESGGVYGYRKVTDDLREIDAAFAAIEIKGAPLSAALDAAIDRQASSAKV